MVVAKAIRAYSQAARARPLATAIVTAGLQTWAADGIAQLVVERRTRLDLRRSALFAGFGVMYIGGFQYFLYSVAFVRFTTFFERVGTVTRLGQHVARALIDQLGHVPTIYFPSFYALKAVAEGRPLIRGECSAASLYRKEGWECLKANWFIWIPAQIVNFAFVPIHLRVPFVSSTSFGWTIILSTMQGAFDGRREKA
jgi:protein Mpv17